MNLPNLLYPLAVLIVFTLLSLPALLAESEPCIVKQKRWCEEHQKQEHLWKVDAHWYLAKETPHGQFEIVGLYRRSH